MKRIAILAALVLASCDRGVQCDDQGHIVIRKDIPLVSQGEARIENIKLDMRRAESGHKWYTPEALERAKGCPS